MLNKQSTNKSVPHIKQQLDQQLYNLYNNYVNIGLNKIKQQQQNKTQQTTTTINKSNKTQQQTTNII